MMKLNTKIKEREEKKNKMKDDKRKNINAKRRNFTNWKKSNEGITLIALVITILFSYDEKLKCSNSKGFLLATI